MHHLYEMEACIFNSEDAWQVELFWFRRYLIKANEFSKMEVSEAFGGAI